MIKMHGNNDFGTRFDFSKWSAPIYENPEESLLAFEKLALRGKVVKSISVIGFAEDICKTSNGLQYHRLHQAGVDWEEIREHNYEHMDEVLLPCEAELYEPFQLIFTDGTTLEMVPTEDGGLRFAVNSIPAGLTFGLNRSNLDAQTLFGAELVGKEFKQLSMNIHKESSTYLTAHVIQNYTPHERIHKDYYYRLEFGGYISLRITAESYRNKYCLQLCSSDRELEIPYKRVTAAQVKTNQIVMMPGHASGGCMWITPISSDDRKGMGRASNHLANTAFSMDDDICCEFLGEFLHRYFDPALQNREEYDRDFDWYGSNSYTFEAIQKMLADIKKTSHLLETDFDSPALKKIKERFHALSFGDMEVIIPLTPEQRSEWIRDHKDIAIDFYDRFAEKMETIMREAKDCDLIVFSGP